MNLKGQTATCLPSLKQYIMLNFQHDTHSCFYTYTPKRSQSFFVYHSKKCFTRVALQSSSALKRTLIAIFTLSRWYYNHFTDNKKTLDLQGFLERETGFEPATLALARRYSTTEPLAHIGFLLSVGAPLHRTNNTILRTGLFVNSFFKFHQINIMLKKY